MDAATATFMTFGAATLLTSWVLLLITSWKEDYSWGLCTLLLPPFSYLYGLFRLDRAGESIFLAFAGCAMLYLSLG